MSSEQQHQQPRLDEFMKESDIEEMEKILQGFYDNFTCRANYFLIGMYVPVIILAVVANLLIIIVVNKYRYMRRYLTLHQIVQLFLIYKFFTINKSEFLKQNPLRQNIAFIKNKPKPTSQQLLYSLTSNFFLCSCRIFWSLNFPIYSFYPFS